MVLGLLFYVKKLWVLLRFVGNLLKTWWSHEAGSKGYCVRKPKNQGITQIKFHRNKRSILWNALDIILVDAAHNAIWNDPRINHVHKHRELRGHLNTKAIPSRRETRKRNNTLSLVTVRF
ncbi:hypothetical protein MKW92_007433, partial [Papaver armeniacum]